jgi:hypothetical protein
MFNEFDLPENIRFTLKGLVLIYNQCEVASYADGAIGSWSYHIYLSKTVKR